MFGFSKKQSVQKTKQPIDLVWQLSQPSQTNFNLFQNLLRTKQPVDSTKQQVVFPLVEKHSILKKVSIHISFRFNKRVDYPLIYPDPTHIQQQHRPFIKHLGFGFFKALDHSWSTVSTLRWLIFVYFSILGHLLVGLVCINLSPIQRKFGPVVLIKENLPPSGSMRILKKFPLKFLYEDVKGAKSMLPDWLIRDNQLIGSGGWDV